MRAPLDVVHADGLVRVASRPFAPGWNGALVVLDRDGVLIEDTGYPHDSGDVRFNEEIVEFLVWLRSAGFRFGFATNQGGIGLGLYDWGRYVELEGFLDAALRARICEPDFWISCAAHPRSSDTHLAAPHSWRKPGPGMILEAIALASAAPSRTMMLGDRETDLAAAAAANVRGVLYRAGATALRETASAIVLANELDRP